MTANGVERYKLIVPPSELQKLKRWAEWAKENSVLDDYLVALKTINYRLSFEPTEWGEPRYSHASLGLEMRLGTFRMLNIWFGVSKAKRIVYVKVIQFRGDYPHGQPPES